MDCNKQIVYSYVDGDNYGGMYRAYKIEGADIRLFQQYKYSFKKKYILIEYSDADGTIISRDTTTYKF